MQDLRGFCQVIGLKKLRKTYLYLRVHIICVTAVNYTYGCTSTKLGKNAFDTLVSCLLAVFLPCNLHPQMWKKSTGLWILSRRILVIVLTEGGL